MHEVYEHHQCFRCHLKMGVSRRLHNCMSCGMAGIQFFGKRRPRSPVT